MDVDVDQHYELRHPQLSSETLEVVVGVHQASDGCPGMKIVTGTIDSHLDTCNSVQSDSTSRQKHPDEHAGDGLNFAVEPPLRTAGT